MKYVVANWKMNKTLEEIKNFVLEMTKTKMEINANVWIAPQFVHIPILKELAFTIGNIEVGAQNVAHFSNGAYTGEVSAEALNDLGTKFIIIGHSERRTLMEETNRDINAKIKEAWKYEIPVILCVGESLYERENKETLNVIKRQLDEALRGQPKLMLDKLLIAYEPVWAIGTGKTATTKDILEVHGSIKKLVGSDVPVLYGGSVKPANIDEIFQINNVDGVLVGGASLQASDFKSLCVSATRNARCEMSI